MRIRVRDKDSKVLEKKKVRRKGQEAVEVYNVWVTQTASQH